MTGVQVAAALWLIVGLGVASTLYARQAPPGTVVSALLAWPLVVPSLLGGPTAVGPFRTDIEAACALTEASVSRHREDLPWLSSLDALRDQLTAADDRLAAVDTAIAELRREPSGVRPDLARLETARDESAARIRDILGRLAQLRVELELRALDDGDASVREAVRALVAQVAALDQLRKG